MAGRALVVAIALVAAMPGTASADHPVGIDTHTGSAAFAWWSPESTGGVVTEVALGAFDDLPGGSSAFVAVFQGWCDNTSDELVSRVFFTEEAAAASIEPLRSAAIAGTVVLDGWEVRIPSCSEPSFEGWTETGLGEFPVDVEASWSGRGAASPYVGAGGWPEPACAFAFAGAGADREAGAEGSIVGDLPLEGGVALTDLRQDASFGHLFTGTSTLAFTALDCGTGDW